MKKISKSFLVLLMIFMLVLGVIPGQVVVAQEGTETATPTVTETPTLNEYPYQYTYNTNISSSTNINNCSLFFTSIGCY